MELTKISNFMFALIYFLITGESSKDFQHKILVTPMLHLDDCKELNNDIFQCSSLLQVINLLSHGYNFTDTILDPGVYILTSSHNITDIHHFRIRSENATVQCEFNKPDTGIAFIRVANLIIEHISFIGCGMKHTSTNFGKGKMLTIRSALFVLNSTNVSLYNMSIANSNGIGLLMYDTDGTVSITGVSFISNKLNLAEQESCMAGGGGIYIHFTNCTPGHVDCDPQSNPYNRNATYVIDRCSFQTNIASYHLKDSEFDNISGGTFVTFGSGGGISVWFYGNAEYNTIYITQSSFVDNAAGLGGGINIRNKQKASYNSVKIAHCLFTNNNSTWEGGGGGVAMGYEIYQEDGKTTYNQYIIYSCSFKYNRALYGVGGGVALFGSREPETSQSTNSFTICSSNFTQNEALYGSAIEVNRQYFDSILVGTFFTLIINSCVFKNNTLNFDCVSLHSTEVSSIGAVSTSGVSINFTGTTLFIGNNQTALAADGAVINFSDNSVTNFSHNQGLRSGGIQLINSAWMQLYPNCTVLFLDNTAVNYAGAIYVQLSTPFDYLLSHVCFVRYHIENVSPREWNFTFVFINNTAGENNNTMFVTTMQPCVKAYTKHFLTWLYKGGQIQHYPNTSPLITTAPSKFNITNDISIIPGEVLDLPVQLLDEMNQTVKPAVLIATCNESPSPYVMSPYHFTNGTIQIAGTPSKVCNLTLQTDANYQITTLIHLHLLSCPPGFTYSNRISQCQCVENREYHNPAITGCDLTSFRAYFSKFYWIGYDIDDSHVFTSFCPYGYCYRSHLVSEPLLPRLATKLDQFVCGDRKRTGVLCGKCIDGHSVALNSPIFKCHHCTNHAIGILYLFLSYILPVTLLFYFIMAYNIRITTGPCGAFLFFSQIISSQYHYEFDLSLKGQTNETLTISSIILAIYSMSNLDFFHHNIFSYCLFLSAGTVDVLAFNLLLSLYPVLLVFVYSLLRRHCNWRYQFHRIFRLSRKSVTHGICAFLILSSAKINALAFGILKSADLNFLNGTLYKRVVYFQGDMEYLKTARYNAYAAGSLVTITVIILIPTLILVLHPIMISVVSYFKWGDSKCVAFINSRLFINKLKPLLDSFQGDYKDNLSFFAGLHSFLYRIIYFTIVIVASTPNVGRLLLLIESFSLAVLIIHVVILPFKKCADNIVYSLMYSTLHAILIIEHYLFTTGESSVGLLWLQAVLVSLPLVCVLVYNSWRLLVVVQIMFKKQRHKRLELDDHYYSFSKFPARVANGEDDINENENGSYHNYGSHDDGNEE